jgi:uncharacterized protein
VTPLQVILLVAAAFVAGVVNSVAGGGTLITFPSLLAFGLLPTVANATSAVSLVPGSAAAMWGFREELRRDRETFVALGLASLAGGIIGAILMLRAGDLLFARLAPWLILVATALFALGDRLPVGRRAGLPTVVAVTILIAIYGGFFGAGMGIAILAGLSLLGITDVHRLNGLKNFISVCIHGSAAVTFILERRVVGWLAALMAAGAIAGGYGGARLARRAGQKLVRRFITLVGIVIAAVLFVHEFL